MSFLSIFPSFALSFLPSSFSVHRPLCYLCSSSSSLHACGLFWCDIFFVCSVLCFFCLVFFAIYIFSGSGEGKSLGFPCLVASHLMFGLLLSLPFVAPLFFCFSFLLCRFYIHSSRPFNSGKVGPDEGGVSARKTTRGCVSSLSFASLVCLLFYTRSERKETTLLGALVRYKLFPTAQLWESWAG